MVKDKNSCFYDKDWETIKQTITPYGYNNKTPPPQRRTASVSSPNSRKIYKQDIAPSPLSHDTPLRHLNKTEAAKIRKRKYSIEGTLDLHGFTRDGAYQRLLEFIMNASHANKRTLLIVTGKGGVSDKSKGVLRENLPNWLAQTPLKNYIIGYTEASPRDGGAGAFYVRLRLTQKM